MKTILIGSVLSSQIVLQKMIDMGFPISMVFSLDQEYSSNVSGYFPIHETALNNGIPFKKFKKINDEENIRLMKELKPEYIFVIGLSQLIDKKILDIPEKGCIGFHPTPLPRMRGRAALVWQILLGVKETKCTLFMLDEGMDSGDILAQEEYVIDDNDYARDVEKKVCDALDRLCGNVLKKIEQGTIIPQKQDESKATYLLVRRPEDGLIDWQRPVDDIYRLIRAVSLPYPGAFSMYDGKHKIIIWKAELLENNNIIGISGQICNIYSNYFDVLGVDGIIRVTEFTNVDNVKLLVGHKLK